MEGQYAHFVADLSHLIGSYEMSVCSLGLMGTEYVRREDLPDQISVSQGQKFTQTFSQVYSSELIGTEL